MIQTVLVSVELIIVYHLLELVYLGDHQVLRQLIYFMLLKMVTMQTQDCLKVMRKRQSVVLLQLHWMVIQYM